MSEAEGRRKAWSEACLALDLLAVDPALCGLTLRARAGPVRAAFLDRLDRLGGPAVRLHPAMVDEQLFGGLDLAATWAAGRTLRQPGLLARPGPRVLVMAERCEPRLAGRLAGVIDDGPPAPLILLDESAAPDETVPPALAERLAFALDLDSVAIGDIRSAEPVELDTARTLLPRVDGTGLCHDLVGICLGLGIHSQRAALFALRTACARAALAGRDVVDETDLETAMRLSLLHRATQLPAAEAPGAAEAGPRPPAADPAADEPAQDRLLDAARALLPPDLLDRIRAGRAGQGRGSGAGALRKGNRRGRPLPSRPGRLDGRNRIDLVATLRAAAPWQRLRGTGDRHLRVLPSDIHVRRYEVASDRLLVFAVDASGSAAFARLAEAKGAVELLLAQAYARRDHVALVAFRGAGAETLLPPTRSLVQAKRRLAALPGGGGTPLAAGLKAAMELALGAGARGLSPTVILLTDGRANVALDGRPDRTAAASNATTLARALSGAGVAALVLDVGTRPEPDLARLAQVLSAPYLALPRADSARLSQAVTAALGR